MAQFLLSDETLPPPPGATTRTLAPWRLCTWAPLPVVELRDATGAARGWLLGWATEADGARVVTGPVTLDAARASAAAGGEHPFPDWGGRFLAVVIGAEGAWCFPDACGSLAAFYAHERRALAWDWTALDDGARHPADVVEALTTCRQNSGTWFPFGLSHNPGVRLLLPSHALDLRTWTTRRIWPRKPVARVSGAGDAAACVRRIGQVTRNQMAALSQLAPLTLNLTAGRDSRMLLACAKPLLDRIVFTTDPKHSDVDEEVARQLTELFSLHHAGLPAALPDRVCLPGFAGEVGRAFYWRRGDHADRRLSTDEILIRLKFNAAPEPLRRELETWRAVLHATGVDTFLELDLLYLEWRVGCTMSPVLHNRDTIHLFAAIPLNHPHVIRAMMELPVKFRRRQRLVLELCRQLWPELLYLPFNSTHFTGAAKYRMWWHTRSVLPRQPEPSRRLLAQIITRQRTVGGMVWDDLVAALGRLRRSPRKAE